LNKKQWAQPTSQAVQSQTAATILCPQDDKYQADSSEESTVPYVGSDRILTDRGKGKKRKIQVKGKQRMTKKKSRLDDPDISLPEESDKDRDLRDLIGSPEKTAETGRV